MQSKNKNGKDKNGQMYTLKILSYDASVMKIEA